jgi:hypothetical protein
MKYSNLQLDLAQWRGILESAMAEKSALVGQISELDTLIHFVQRHIEEPNLNGAPTTPPLNGAEKRSHHSSHSRPRPRPGAGRDPETLCIEKIDRSGKYLHFSELLAHVKAAGIRISDQTLRNKINKLIDENRLQRIRYCKSANRNYYGLPGFLVKDGDGWDFQIAERMPVQERARHAALTDMEVYADGGFERAVEAGKLY